MAESTSPQKPKYLDTSLSIRERTLDLIAHLSLDEKVGLMKIGRASCRERV